VLEEIRRVHVVFGAYEGEIEVKGKERVLFVGDCARWKGQIAGQAVDIPSLYQDRVLIRPEQVKASDLIGKMFKVLGERMRFFGKRVLRIPGCTVSVAEIVLHISKLGRTKNPYYDYRLVLGFVWHWSIAQVFRFFGKRRAPHPEALVQPDAPEP